MRVQRMAWNGNVITCFVAVQLKLDEISHKSIFKMPFNAFVTRKVLVIRIFIGFNFRFNL